MVSLSCWRAPDKYIFVPDPDERPMKRCFEMKAGPDWIFSWVLPASHVEMEGLE